MYHEEIFTVLSPMCVLLALYLLVKHKSGPLALVALMAASASFVFSNPDVIDKFRVGLPGFEASRRVRSKAEELSRSDLPPLA